MLYSSPEFLALFLATAAAYAVASSHGTRFGILLAASLAFYAWAGLFDALVFLFVVLVSWSAVAASVRRPDLKRPLLAAGVSLMALHLAFWKYAPWAASQIQILFPRFLDGRELLLPLPVGISFFTLQGIAYLIDFGRDEAKAMNFSTYLLFKSFFAQLVAGPIVRARQFLPQLERLPRPTGEDAAVGLSLFVQGFAKKMLLADRVTPFVDAAFLDPATQTRATLILALLGYTVQIWADFSGYTDMGRGAARMLGLRLPENFLSPYLSRSPSEFWRRWHITLSEWIRDYVYFSFGGGRGSFLRVVGVVILTMALSGLWHGASWHFVIWGLYHGALLAGERAWRAVTPETWIENPLGKIISWAVTLFAVVFGWLIFRATDMNVVVAYTRGLILGGGTASTPPHGANVVAAVLACAALHAAWYADLKTGDGLAARLRAAAQSAAPAWGLAAGAALAAVFLGALMLRPVAAKAFIYFQF